MVQAIIVQSFVARHGYSGGNRRLWRHREYGTRSGRHNSPWGPGDGRASSNRGPGGNDGGSGGNDSGDIADSDTGRRAGDGSPPPHRGSHRSGSGAGRVRLPIVRIANPPPDVESNRTWVGGWLYIFQHDVFAETLLGNDETTGEPFPLLAESWETNADFTEWSFKLREGIPFQHGWGDVSTADVVHTYNQLIREDSLASLRTVWDTVTTEVVDDHNIKFHFQLPYLDGRVCSPAMPATLLS